MSHRFGVRFVALFTVFLRVAGTAAAVVVAQPALPAPVGGMPVQRGGSAAGLGHEVDAAATRADKELPEGCPPASGELGPMRTIPFTSSSTRR